MLHRTRDVGRKVSPPQPTFMSDDQKSDYLKSLRNDRLVRPAGSRPLPSKSNVRPSLGHHVLQRAESALSMSAGAGASTDAIQITEPPRNVSVLSNRYSMGSMVSETSPLLLMPTKGRPLVQDPSSGLPSLRGRKVSPTAVIAPAPGTEVEFKESGVRQLERKEAHSLRKALEVMDEQEEEKRIYDAAQNEAAHLVWQHRNPKEVEKEKTTAYRNPDISRAARFKAQMAKAHERSKSEGYAALGKGPIKDEQPRVVSDDSNYSQGSSGAVEKQNETAPRSRRQRLSDALRELPIAFSRSDAASGDRVSRRSSGGHRRSSGQRNVSNKSMTSTFRNPEDQIYEEPEGVSTPKTSEPAKLEEEQKALKTRSRNSLLQGSRMFSEKSTSVPTISKFRSSPFDRHRNPPVQPRASPYTSNAVTSPPVEPEGVSTKHGIEIRSDDIRAATSMRRKDRSPNLPTPTAVSDRPGRLIVSFDKKWQPSSTNPQNQRELPSRPSPIVPLMALSAPVIPTINLPDEDNPSIPTMNLPGEDGSSISAINLPDKHDPSVSTIAFPKTDNTPSIAISEARALPSTKPPRRPLPQQTQSSPPKISPTKHPKSSRLPWLAKGNSPTAKCASCTLPISGRIVTASGSDASDPKARFHPTCFTCHHCVTPLECVAFFPEPDSNRIKRLHESGMDEGNDPLRFYCHLDFHEFFSPRCRNCKTPIEGEVILAAGGEYHVGHFFCAECGDPFAAETPFVERDGYAWCVGCHRKRTSGRCRGCRGVILEDESVEALGGVWHDGCFCCVECGGGFAEDGGRFYVREMEVELTEKERRMGKGGKVEERAVCVGCEGLRLKQ